MLSKINSSEIYTRFLIAYRKHNAACPEYTFSRTCKKTGRVTEITRKKGGICQSVKTTFFNILSEYVKSYVNVSVNMPDNKMFTDADPPSLFINSVFLASNSDCSPRTIRYHITKLMDLGVIRKKTHGRILDYELWIMPEFLYGGEGDTVFKKRIPGLKTDLLINNGKILPQNKIYREIYEIEKGNKDMFISHGESKKDGEGGRTEPLPLSAIPEQSEKEQAGGAAALSRAEILARNEEKRLLSASKALEGRLLKGPRNLDAKFLNMLLDFWFYSWKVLYPNRSFTRDQQEKALIAIMAGVYNNFSDERSEKDWIDFQALQLNKLDKAGKYYDHHPEQYAPDPYAIAIAGKGYFDAANTKGFMVIDGWIKVELGQKARNKAARDNQKLERQTEKDMKAREVLRKARIDIERERAGLKLRKETLGKSIIGIYQYYHTILRGIGKGYSDKLDEQFIDQQARDFAPPKYDRAKRIRKTVTKLQHDPTPATVVYIDSFSEGDGEGYYVSED